MSVTMQLPSDTTRRGETCSTVQIVETEHGVLDPHWFQLFTKAPQSDAERLIVLSCDFDQSGPWAGVNELFDGLLPEIERDCPDLIAGHALELTSVLPQLRRTTTIPHQALTDTAPGEEKVRNYAADRAFRNIHGLIEMLFEWTVRTSQPSRWVIVCQAFNRAGFIGSHFFSELHRRCTPTLDIRFILVTTKGQSANLATSFRLEDAVMSTPVVGSGDHISTRPSQSEAACLAMQIEEGIGADVLEKQLKLPKLLELWKCSGDMSRVIRLKLFGVAVYLHEGLYADALRFGDELLMMAKLHEPNNVSLHREIVIKILNGLLGIPDAKRAMSLIQEEVLPLSISAPDDWKIDAYYLVAMVYGRYLQPRNFRCGEDYLDLALSIIEKSDLSEERKQFLHVFNRNGLAMIRSFQRRSEEAISLCKSGLARLDTYVPRDKHQLHRSVLLYNVAKVCAATGSLEEAIHFYSEAIEMDPNYSEYYNERGSLYLAAKRWDVALADYHKAVELSPPYYEVFANIGQCYRNMGLDAQAVLAYTRSIELEPVQVLAWLGRAQSYENLMQGSEALADYTTAIRRDPTQWEAFASRGSLYYAAGKLDLALQDLDAAIRLAPGTCDLYQNRSLVLSALLAQDMRLALSLNPSEEDRVSLVKRLVEITQGADIQMQV